MPTKLVNGKRVDLTPEDIASLPTEADILAGLAKREAKEAKRQKDISDIAKKLGVSEAEFKAAVKAAMQG